MTTDFIDLIADLIYLIAPYGPWVAALFALLAWVSPSLHDKYKKRRIRQGVSISGLELSGVIAPDEHKGNIFPFWNIKVNLTNQSRYSVDVRSRIIVEGDEISQAGFQNTTTREALNHVFTLNPADEARCFFARLIPNIDCQVPDKNINSTSDSINIANPNEYIRSDPPSANTDAWLEFIGEIPPNTTGGSWTAKSGASIDVESRKTIRIEIITLEGATLDFYDTTTVEILKLAKESGWSNIAEIKTPTVVSRVDSFIKDVEGISE